MNRFLFLLFCSSGEAGVFKEKLGAAAVAKVERGGAAAAHDGGR